MAIKTNYLTTKQAAELSGLSAGHLANLRSTLRGAKYFKRGRRVLYEVASFDEWLRECPVLTQDQRQ